MESVFCGFCQPRDTQVIKCPTKTLKSTEFGRRAIDPQQIKRHGFCVVVAEKNHHTIANLEKGITKVHIHGHPFFWLVELIIEKAPDIKEIQLIPSERRRLSPNLQKFCKEKNIRIIFGHASPGLAWKKGEVRRSKNYKAQFKFLQNLSGEQKILFNELLAFGFDSAKMTAEYFGIKPNIEVGKEVKFLQDIVEKYGYSSTTVHAISEIIQGIFNYLDPNYVVNKRSKLYADTLRSRVSSLRIYFTEYYTAMKAREEIALKLGLKALPNSIPLYRLDVLEAIIKAKADGRLEQLQKKFPRGYKVVILRFGLDQENSSYRTLGEVGKMVDNLTRERIRQIEAKALRILGLADTG